MSARTPKPRFKKVIAPAVALAMAFGTVTVPNTPAAPVAAAQAANTQPVIDTTGFTTEQWMALTSQATLEMINEYRVANGLHPLRTHKLYNEQSEKWSHQMIKDRNDCKRGEPSREKYCLSVAFRHSDEKEWGRSGENILYRNSLTNNDKNTKRT